MKNKARVIAFYLPQYHPIPENDEMWGKGFTEWTNVAKAKPLFKGHYQPQIPSELGFYDLRMPETRIAQAELAKEHGVEGFCYWHYWFGNGKEILERPFKEVLKTGEPNFPFCLGWANHSWSNKTWQKTKNINKTVEFIHQDYPGDQDYIEHFYAYLDAFKDERYIKVDDKPLFLIFDPTSIPDNSHFISLWNKLAKENGLNGFYFVGRLQSVGSFKNNSKKEMMKSIDKRYDKYLSQGYNAINSSNMRYASIKYMGFFRKAIRTCLERTIGNVFPEKYKYNKIIKFLTNKSDYREDVIPTLIPRWDKTPRRGKNAEIFVNTTPENFGYAIDNILDCVKNKQEEHKLVFLFAWNEWGEGAYLEPDIKYGREHLKMLKSKIVEE